VRGKEERIKIYFFGNLKGRGTHMFVDAAYSALLQTEAGSSREILVSFYRITQLGSPEKSVPCVYSLDSIKFDRTTQDFTVHTY
jgi:hypothetical protein